MKRELGRRRSVGCLTVVVLATSCATKAPLDQASSPTAAVPIPAATASAAPTAAAVPTAKATASEAAPAAMPAAQLPIRSTTPGKIQCETVDCDVNNETCCAVQAFPSPPRGQCAPRGTSAEPNPRVDCAAGNDASMVARTCDEAADCRPKERCCSSITQGDGSQLKERCATSCGAYAESEVCLAGSTCPNGARCIAKEAARAGYCPLRVRPVKCGAKTCTIDQACCWDQAAKTGTCVDDRGAETKCAGFVAGCAGPEDCGSLPCATEVSLGPKRIDCGGLGGPGSFEVACRTAADCPTKATTGAVPSACKSGALPMGLKSCAWP